MHLLRTVIGGIAGTTAMTAYSYIRARDEHKQYSEPQTLNELADNAGWIDEKGAGKMLGWALHYCTGVAFSASYAYLLDKYRLKPGLVNGLLLGVTAGLVGVGIWKTVFTLHPAPPRMDLASYLKHLMAAHAVFGVADTLTHRALMRSDK